MVFVESVVISLVLRATPDLAMCGVSGNTEIATPKVTETDAQ